MGDELEAIADVSTMGSYQSSMKESGLMHRLIGAAATALAALAVGVLVGPAAAAAPAGGPIELYASAGNAGSQHIVVVGAIGDYGTALNVNKNGKPNPNGNYVKVRLKKGTFVIDVTAMNKAINSEQNPQVGSHATCSAAFTGSAPVTFLKGTGLYKGISGTANVTLTFGGVGSTYKSGPKKGLCKQGDQSPRSSFGFVTGQGTVSFAP
jgi:hypothetical protein